MTYGILTLLEEGRAQDWDKVVGYLRRKGHQVYTATSLKDAYRLLRDEPVSIVLAEFNLPGVNHLQFLRRLKQIKPSAEAIYLSHKVPLNRAIEAMKHGAYDVYEFPLNSRLLMAVIEKAAEKQALYFAKAELERRVKEKFNYGNIIGRSKPMQKVIEIIGSVAPKNVNVLITGETGTGKEMVANAVHFASPRNTQPFVKLNCAALSEGVLESELFGHEKGAFTGALARRLGRFELAHKGTLFLDEVGDIPLSTQVKLLRVLQERQFERVGGNETISVDVRVIAATNFELPRLIEERRFREDLYYRLNVVHVAMPPLRDRKEDIPLLASYFINKLNAEKGYNIKGIGRECMQILMNHTWPGNVRELENTLESAMALSAGDFIEARYLPSVMMLPGAAAPGAGHILHLRQDMKFEEMEQEILAQTLARTKGNKTQAARLLGIGLRTLQRKLK